MFFKKSDDQFQPKTFRLSSLIFFTKIKGRKMKIFTPFPKLRELLQPKFAKCRVYGTLNYGCSSLNLSKVEYPIYNPPSAVCLAIDKLASQSVLETYHLIPPLARSDMGQGTYIVKPQKGMEGRGIYFSETPVQREGYICQVFIPTVYEYRVIVALDTIVGIFKKTPYRSSANPRIRNAQYGWEWRKTPEENEAAERIAIRAALIMGLDVCGVDVGIQENGKAIVFELNSASWLNSAMADQIVHIFEERGRSKIQNHKLTVTEYKLGEKNGTECN